MPSTPFSCPESSFSRIPRLLFYNALLLRDHFTAHITIVLEFVLDGPAEFCFAGDRWFCVLHLIIRKYLHDFICVVLHGDDD